MLFLNIQMLIGEPIPHNLKQDSLAVLTTRIKDQHFHDGYLTLKYSSFS